MASAERAVHVQTGDVVSLSADNAGEAKQWDLLVDRASAPDVYYRPGYALAYQEMGEGKAIAAIVSAGGVRALFPLLLRSVDRLPFGHAVRGYDAATPYGYGGFLLLDGVKNIDTGQATELLLALREWCREHDVVSAYLRLHPMAQQGQRFANLPEEGISTHFHGWTAAIEAAHCDPEQEFRSTLHLNRRRNLIRARANLTLSWSSEGGQLKAYLDVFRRLYEHRMQALNAAGYYTFPTRYYRALADGLGSRLEIGLAWRGNEAVGAVLFLTGELYWHYHLGGSNEDGRKYGASTLLMWEGAKRASQRGCRYLHLGGGLHGDDALLAFKKSFGGPVFRYFAVSVICDRKAYTELRLLRNASSAEPPRAGFFPAYRA